MDYPKGREYYRRVTAYGDSLEAITVIEYVCHDLMGIEAFCLGSLIKYVMRAGNRDGLTIESDLEKARTYAYRLVNGHWPNDMERVNNIDAANVATVEVNGVTVPF